MKAGDIVRVVDGSYSVSLVRGKVEHLDGNSLRGRKFRVLDTDGSYPTYCSPLDAKRNGAMMVDVNDSDLVLFTRERFCRVLTPAAPVPENTLEVSVSSQTKRVVLVLQ